MVGLGANGCSESTPLSASCFRAIPAEEHLEQQMVVASSSGLTLVRSIAQEVKRKE